MRKLSTNAWALIRLTLTARFCRRQSRSCSDTQSLFRIVLQPRRTDFCRARNEQGRWAEVGCRATSKPAASPGDQSNDATSPCRSNGASHLKLQVCHDLDELVLQVGHGQSARDAPHQLQHVHVVRAHLSSDTQFESGGYTCVRSTDAEIKGVESCRNGLCW